LATTVKEFIEIFKLRSEIYTQIGYDNEFPDYINGLNFDKFDENSALLYTKIDNEITGTCRVIFDSNKKLPIDKYYSINHLREKYFKIAESSRLVVKHQKAGLNQEFKLLMNGLYSIGINNYTYHIVSVIKDEHFRFYQKFGGFKLEYKFNNYGKMSVPIIMVSWSVLEISNFFKKAFLKSSIA